MNEADKEKLRAFWASRALAETRRAYVSSGGDDPLFHILQAAILPIPLFLDEPYFQVTTPLQHVGGIIDEAGFVRANVYLPDGTRRNAVKICPVKDLVDNLESLAEALKLTDFEYACMKDKVRQWITHDDREGEQNMRFDGVTPAQAQASIQALRAKAQALSDSWHKKGKRSGRQPRTRH